MVELNIVMSDEKNKTHVKLLWLQLYLCRKSKKKQFFCVPVNGIFSYGAWPEIKWISPSVQTVLKERNICVVRELNISYPYLKN